ncbi:DUF4880 domain-containing protein [Asticcacaulis solisilvae]|uniref:DUF4880 domain-containing protein n=1 Tax=Asticcacaulis solisilvae TaxID=1217274 RepID=UPI003FD8BA83
MDDAALWLARLDSGSADPAAFEAWRAEDPRRAAAFAQIAGAARALDRVKPELKQRAEREKPVDRRQFVFAGAAAATLAIGGGLAAFFVGQSKATASTRVGGRRTISLALGGRLELNTDSKVQWKAQDKRLQVWLRRGEIALDIRAPIQQCILYGGHTVAALGVGKVNARLRGDLLDLTVVSGECTVASTGAMAPVGPTPSRRPVIVKANEAVLAGGGEADQARHGYPGRARLGGYDKLTMHAASLRNTTISTSMPRRNGSSI